MVPLQAFQLLILVIFCITNGQGINARDLKADLLDQKQVDSNDEPSYMTQYGDTKPNYPASDTTVKHHNHVSHTPKLIDSYLNRYKTQAHDSNEPYFAGYKTQTHDSNEPYFAGYKTQTHDSNEPYFAGYKTQTHDSNEPYFAGYKTQTHDSNEPYFAGYKTQTHNSNKPYITSYSDHQANQPNYIAAYKTHDHDSIEPYIAEYISTALNPKGHISTNTEEPKGPLFSNLDRTKAFKTGFFNLDDLHAGNVMTLQFPIQKVSHFLSKKEANSLPLSMSQLPSVLQLLSISKDSPQVQSMRGTLEQCEGEPITGETKICANSLESMLDFVDKIIGSDTKRNILTTNNPSPTAIPLQKYTILEVSHDINAPKWVACHPMPYPYAIYYCHYISTGTKVFKVSLVGDENGDKMEALGVCHLDTSDWNPDHIVFKQLGIKAGKNSPICHFFPVNHLLWVPMLSSESTM